MGLNALGIPTKLQRKIVSEVANIIITSTSYKPSLETLYKRINRNRELIGMIVSKMMIEEMGLRKLTNEQLEYVVYNGGKMIVSYIPEIYKELLRRGRNDLIEYLKYVWEKNGRPTPVECPKCGFRAIMPDYTCYVCGHVVSDEYIRRSLGFDEKFPEYIRNASVAELREVAEIGFVLVGEDEVRSPKNPPPQGKIYYPVYLRKKEISMISLEIAQRKLPI
jgi:hypothetical protein